MNTATETKPWKRKSPAPGADATQHVPPHNIEAEQAVIGGIFINAEIGTTLADILCANDFYLPAHATIYSAFLELLKANAPVDLVTVAGYLKDRSLLERVGGAAYLAELAQATLSTANAEFCAGNVRDKALARRMIDACSKIITRCFDTSVPIDELLDSSEKDVLSVGRQRSGQVIPMAGSMLNGYFDALTERFNRKQFLTGVPTGYSKLDSITFGLQPSDLIIIGARPSVGKTAFALNLALRAALLADTPVVIFSLEMATNQLLERMLCIWGKIEIKNLRGSSLDETDWARLIDAADKLKNAPIFIDDTPGISSLELRSRVRRLHRTHNIGMVIVDYLQLMQGPHRTDKRELEIAEISRGLKALAKELNVPVVALSQLNRSVEKRDNKRPMLSDLRESGSIEQDADIIMFVHREDMVKPAKERPAVQKTDIIIGKHRNGAVEDLVLDFHAAFNVFEEPFAYSPEPPADNSYPEKGR